jgi:predicted DNA-binding transcriptional regulator AlpA
VSETAETVAPFRFNVEDAARYIGMSESWLWASDIPRVKLGSRVHWLREDLEQYLRSHRTHGSAA